MTEEVLKSIENDEGDIIILTEGEKKVKGPNPSIIRGFNMKEVASNGSKLETANVSTINGTGQRTERVRIDKVIAIIDENTDGES